MFGWRSKVKMTSFAKAEDFSEKGNELLEPTVSQGIVKMQNKKRKTSDDDEYIHNTSVIQENHQLRTEIEKLKEKLREITPKKNKQIVSSVFTLNDEIEGVRTWSLKRLASVNTVEELDKQAEERLQYINAKRTLSPATNNLVEAIISETQNTKQWRCEFLGAENFVDNFVNICRQISALLKKEERVLKLSSPCYVLGDIHGNVDDLRFFGTKLWPLGMHLTGNKALFMGDYVDRGYGGIEVVAYLFARKIRHPKKLFMLRGNHETVEINTWHEQYRSRSFLAQCWKRFGRQNGTKLCLEINRTFQHLPFAAVIDDGIFCVHGGIPPSEGEHIPGNRLEQINTIPCPILIQSPGNYNYDSEEDDLASSTFYDDDSDDESFAGGPPVILPEIGFEGEANSPGNTNDNMSTAVSTAFTPGCPHSAQLPQKDLTKYHQRMAFNLLWADPATDEQEAVLMQKNVEFMTGRRGEFSVVYGYNAIDSFLRETNLKLVIRAHEASERGVKICKHARCLTVFSTSKDHGVNPEKAACACVLVDREKISIINKSSAGEIMAEKNKMLQCDETIETDFDFLN